MSKANLRLEVTRLPMKFCLLLVPTTLILCASMLRTEFPVLELNAAGEAGRLQSSFRKATEESTTEIPTQQLDQYLTSANTGCSQLDSDEVDLSKLYVTILQNVTMFQKPGVETDTFRGRTGTLTEV